MTREQLEQDHIADGIARWGEAERPGLERQARSKSLETPRVEYDPRHGDGRAALEASLMRQRAAGVPEQYQAGSCLDDGPS